MKPTKSEMINKELMLDYLNEYIQKSEFMFRHKQNNLLLHGEYSLRMTEKRLNALQAIKSIVEKWEGE